MLKILFTHNWKQLRHSPDRHKSIAINILFSFFLLIGMLNLLMIGFFLNRAIREDIAPGKNPVDVLNGILLYYFCVEASLRLWFQKIHTAQFKSYLLLNVKRSSIAHFILVKSLFSWFNFFPLLLFIPFAVKEASTGFPAGTSAIWMLTIIALMMANSYFCIYIKMRFSVAAKILSPLLLAAVITFGFALYKYITMQTFSSQIFGSVIIHPVFALIPLLILGLLYALNFRYLMRHFYAGETRTSHEHITGKERFAFLKAMGTPGRIMLLDLKLLMRNKRAKYVLWLSLIMVFYGLLLRPQEVIAKDLMLMFMSIFSTGFFVISYGTPTFCWESTYAGLITTSPLRMQDFFRAKINMMFFMSLLTFILSMFYLLYGSRFLLVNSAMFLYNTGINSFLVLFFSTYNKKRYLLSADMFSHQGKDTLQYFVFFIIFAIQCAIFFPVKAFLSGNYAFITLGILGFIGILMKNKLIELLASQFNSRKYIMLDGIKNSN